jgi:hypothetical protein
MSDELTKFVDEYLDRCPHCKELQAENDTLLDALEQISMFNAKYCDADIAWLCKQALKEKDNGSSR